MRALAVAMMVALGGAGCAADLEQARIERVDKVRHGAAAEPRDDEECRSLSREQRIWGGIAKGGGFATGSSGLSAWLLEDETSSDVRLAIGITGVALGALTAAAIYVSEDAADEWATSCSK